MAGSMMAAATVQAAPQEVTMLHYFDQKPEQEMLADMVEEYNSLQDDIHINATFVSRTELMNQYTVGALSGELPDIGQVDSPDMESYISLGVFEDITDELESWGELDQFYDGPLSSCKDPDGKVYGLPQNSNCLALACNMDLLKAAGYDHMPQSLDEFKEMVGGYIPELLKPHRLGGNPDLAWCGDATAKKLCLKSRYNVGEEECLDFFIRDLIKYE